MAEVVEWVTVAARPETLLRLIRDYSERRRFLPEQWRFLRLLSETAAGPGAQMEIEARIGPAPTTHVVQLLSEGDDFVDEGPPGGENYLTQWTVQAPPHRASAGTGNREPGTGGPEISPRPDTWTVKAPPRHAPTGTGNREPGTGGPEPSPRSDTWAVQAPPHQAPTGTGNREPGTGGPEPSSRPDTWAAQAPPRHAPTGTGNREPGTGGPEPSPRPDTWPDETIVQVEMRFEYGGLVGEFFARRRLRRALREMLRRLKAIAEAR